MVIASRRAVSIVALSLSLGISACASAGQSPAAGSPGEPSAGATAIQVTLQEWAVLPAEASAPSGDVTFQITNDGPDDPHEFVVLKTDLDPGSLPTDTDGAVDEEGEGMEVIGEVEDIAVGEARDLTVPLTAGAYVLLCNIYDETEKEAHYTMGMRVAFTVGG